MANSTPAGAPVETGNGFAWTSGKSCRSAACKLLGTKAAAAKLSLMCKSRATATPLTRSSPRKAAAAHRATSSFTAFPAPQRVTSGLSVKAIRRIKRLPLPKVESKRQAAPRNLRQPRSQRPLLHQNRHPCQHQRQHQRQRQPPSQHPPQRQPQRQARFPHRHCS